MLIKEGREDIIELREVRIKSCCRRSVKNRRENIAGEGGRINFIDMANLFSDTTGSSFERK